MKSFALVLTLGIMLLAFGCQRATGGEDTLSFEDQDVVLAVEEGLPIQWVDASFLSGSGTFSYTFKYNNYLLKLLDTPVESAADFGPRFEATGGAEIKGYTILANELDLTQELSAVQIIGKHRVSRSSVTVGECTVQKAATDFFDEALVLEITLCQGDDEDRAEEALESLFDELRFERL
ncbi:hypothetical protein A3J23_01950 [Candidatus Peregrinibacteria bacterium RIFCSPLOWO2_02_FULL_48_14]|nr:MAG: hypothetical protein A3J23_01950 [Candidatus Peregrinibacteria bacterium RIFCSPLOWO2_02_FULL_48_14]